MLDYNGTLACGGQLLDGVKPRLVRLSQQLCLHVVTADTFGAARAELVGVPCALTILPPSRQDTAKLEYIQRLGCDATVCIGNGRNDHAMLKAAAVGIAVLQQEGAALETLLAADVVTPDITTALDLLIEPLRLMATLRS